MFFVPGPAIVTGPGQAQGGLAGRALAPGPAPSPATGPGDLATRTDPGQGPGQGRGGQEAAAAPKKDATTWKHRHLTIL